MFERQKKVGTSGKKENSLLDGIYEFFQQLIGELFIYFCFAIIVGLGGGIYLAYTFVGIGSLLLIFPYIVLIYYLYRKLSS